MHIFSSSATPVAATANDANQESSSRHGNELPREPTITDPAPTSITTLQPGSLPPDHDHVRKPRGKQLLPNTLHIYTGRYYWHIFGEEKKTCLYTVNFRSTKTWVLRTSGTGDIVGFIEQQKPKWSYLCAHLSATLGESQLTGMWYGGRVTSVFTWKSASPVLQGETLVARERHGLHGLMECKDLLQNLLFYVRAKGLPSRKQGRIHVVDERMKDEHARDEMVLVALMFIKHKSEVATERIIANDGIHGGG